MYEDFLETILTYIKALNTADEEISKRAERAGSSITFPEIGNIPVSLDGQLVGHLVDELGGMWSYQELAVRDDDEG